MKKNLALCQFLCVQFFGREDKRFLITETEYLVLTRAERWNFCSQNKGDVVSCEKRIGRKAEEVSRLADMLECTLCIPVSFPLICELRTALLIHKVRTTEE
ncbi:hypothetical protein CDAR_371011 [Caerostris darwini]|uniref:Uncharacterized protein n=1 Tax=Caerostris darwini TaxID=1538125 RepID=A0AAV4NFM9_9ARAC|nr:hypothetical protein CDAR_371011 [Caerostris darwini]